MLQSLRLNWLLLTLLTLLVSCGGESSGTDAEANCKAAACQDPVTAIDAMKSSLFTLVNDERASRGLTRLQMADALTDEAQEHTENMATGRSSFGHTGMSARCSRAKARMGGGNLCGEIVARYQATPQAAFDSWMNSAGHRAKILESRYTRMGIGIEYDSDERLYWTILFLEF